MKGTRDISIVLGTVLAGLLAGPVLAAKDETRLPGMTEPVAPSGGLSIGPLDASPGEEPLLQIKPGDDGKGQGAGRGEDNGSEIVPAISTVETIELDADIAKRAIDGFVRLKELYQDTDIAEYESLEQFVAEADQGPALEKDIKSFGFKTVGEWNTAITSVSFAYAALSGTHEDEIKQELDNIKTDVNLDDKMRKSLIEGLQSMLPSDNNKKVVGELNKDKDWAKKLKLLEDSAGEAEH